MRIIPAIDIIEGRCVRLEQGDYSRKKIYDKDPLEFAKQLEGNGFRYLHLVDLDGAKAGKPVNIKVLENICSQTSLVVDYGGGVKDTAALSRVFDNGAQQVTAGSIAVKNPEEVGGWLEQFGSEKIILGADVNDKKVYINGWKTETDWDLFLFLKFYLEKGIQYVVCTDISRDGLLAGSAVELYKEILKSFPTLKLIASGGVSSAEDLGLLQNAGLDGAIVGKALLENKITINQIERYVS
ncbi:Phosphoribosylformimino-5-aminoimidazole carboxamide ribotide isomerase [hydrothermal vent metagenome]|uniref:1-(5-phosphoribosyl)-5-[(5-phosphoribosylamino)methylideneamino]imidazole-4-carboxamideisomerase n=1 Tax=hydrothermal vent metagenome TaxID=652676 RepID=A0A3B0V5F3_9ZZZZ